MTSASLAANAGSDARVPAPGRVTPIRPPASANPSTEPVADDEALEATRRAAREARRLAQREALRPIVLALLPPLLGFALFIGIWTLISQSSPQLPAPIKVCHSAV